MKRNTICGIFIVGLVHSLKVLQCNSGGLGRDDAFTDLKYIGSPGWPTPLGKAFNCEWDLTVNKYDRGKFLKISFIDFKTDCTKRSRIWLKEGGRQIFMRSCGEREIKDYISRSGRVTVGVDFGRDAHALVSYQAVSPRSANAVPDEIVRLKMAVKSSNQIASGTRTYPVRPRPTTAGARTAFADYSEQLYYDITSAPSRAPFTPRVQIYYTPRAHNNPTKAVIKIAKHEQKHSHRGGQHDIHKRNKDDKEALGLRNVLLTCIFGALGVIFLCAIIYCGRRYLLKVEEDKMAELTRRSNAKSAEQKKLEEAQMRYEMQSTKIQASYKDRKM